MRTGFIGTLIGGCIFALIGYLVAFYLGKPMLDDAKASAAWPSVPGVVEQSRVVSSSGNNNNKMFAPDVRYRYTVDNQEMQGDQVSFGDGWKSSARSLASAVTNRYPVGCQVEVFYAPNDPGNSVLEPGAGWKSYLVYGIGLAFLVIGVLMFIGPFCYLLFGTLIVAGAAGGLIGRRKTADPRDWQAPPHAAKPTQRQSARPSLDANDDGFDIG